MIHHPEPASESRASIAAIAARYRVGRTEAAALAAHAMGVPRAWVIAHDREPIPAEQARCLRTLLERRTEGVPMAYLTGRREFYGLELAVTSAVLIPRPETELLVDLTLSALRSRRDRVRVLDLGTGSGAVALALAAHLPEADIWACDASPAALEVASENARRLDLKVHLLASDWFSALAHERFDVILANPPYVAEDDPHLAQGDVRFEPRAALCAGRDGLSAIRIIVSHARDHLIDGGTLWIEHGYQHAPSVRSMLASPHWVDVGSWCDLAGHERVTGARAAAARSEGS